MVAQYIAHEKSLGRLVNPVASEGIRTNPIGLIPKAHQLGRWWMIVDLSCPPGSSVNDGIDPSLSSIRYASVDNAVKIICSLVQWTLLTKFDVKDVIPVHPSDHHRLGIMWDGATYVD